MKFLNLLKLLGPGFVIAATGLGAGDLVAATVSGARLGTLILWSVIAGALIKLVLNEGLARWQLISGTTLLEGWLVHLPRWVNLYFLGFLFLWSFVVSGALMAACGLASHALLPIFTVNTWGVLHSMTALALVLFGRYEGLERFMKLLIGLMFVTVIGSLFFIDLSGLEILKGLLIPGLPEQELTLVLGVIGGVGGSVTLLCYGYWMAEKGWQSRQQLPLARMDILMAYSLTAAFGIGIMVLAAKAQPENVTGTQIILALANELGRSMDPVFYWLFLAGFWGAVFSSMLGVWQGVPYLFADFVKHWQKSSSSDLATDSLPHHGTEMNSNAHPTATLANKRLTRPYLFFLVFLAFPPAAMLWSGKPVWLVLVYSVTGALFMPFLALTLAYLNNLKIDPRFRNSFWSNSVILVAILLFVALALYKLLSL